PFDGIIVTAAAPAVPEELVEQLAPGGVAVVPVGDRMLQRLTILRKGEDGRIETEEDVPCVFVPLIGRKGWR
ncbi:MAG: protein-L-isoaspartate O-methyltransferase, partial [Planctomycetota bacterium]